MYEDLYDLGLMMQTPDSMKLFDNGFRPWPHVYKAGRRSQRFYSRIDANLGALTLTLTHTLTLTLTLILTLTQNLTLRDQFGAITKLRDA